MKLTKTTALKASLFLVLAANMSWEKIDFGSIELAATGTPESVQAAGTAPAVVTAAAPTSVSPPALSVKVAAAPVSEAKPVQPTHIEDKHLLVCGDKYQVRYQQFESEGMRKTIVRATRISNADDSMEMIVRQDLITAISNKESTHANLTRYVKSMRVEKKQSCPGDMAATDEKTDEDRTKLAEDQKNCKVDRFGKALRGDRFTTCLTRELGRVDKRIEKKDSEGKRLSEKQLARNALSEIQKLSGTLKAELRKALMSKDEMRVEEARSAIGDAIEAVQTAATEYGDDDEVKGFDKSIKKIVGELEALKKGSETKVAAEDLKERAEAVKKNMRESYQGVLAEPLSHQANLDYQNAIREFNLLRHDVANDFENDELAAFKRFKSAHLISGTDYNDFVKPYTDLQKLLKEALATPKAVSSTQTFSGKITGSVLGSDFPVPTNLAQNRMTHSAGTARVLGTTLPTAVPSVQPNMSLQPPRSAFGN